MDPVIFWPWSGSLAVPCLGFHCVLLSCPALPYPDDIGMATCVVSYLAFWPIVARIPWEDVSLHILYFVLSSCGYSFVYPLYVANVLVEVRPAGCRVFRFVGESNIVFRRTLSISTTTLRPRALDFWKRAMVRNNNNNTVVGALVLQLQPQVVQRVVCIHPFAHGRQFGDRSYPDHCFRSQPLSSSGTVELLHLLLRSRNF